MNLRRRVARAVPAIARRDAELARRKQRIDKLKGSVDALEAQLEKTRAEAARRVDLDDYLSRPSFHRNILTLRRTTVDLRELDPQFRHPLRHLPFKLRNYRFAASHGIPVPTVLRTWTSPEEIALGDLPEAFVVKSDGGAGSHGVLPLRRTEEDVYQTLDGERTLTAEEVRAHFVERAGAGRISGPYFVEAVLRQPGGGPIPDDIKIYATYGEVHQVLLRRVGRHGDLRSVTRRYVAADGSDLGEVLVGTPADHGIPVPDSLGTMVAIARHLSLASGLPFVRVDLYDTDEGVVLGEVTRAPGGNQRFRPDHDELLGRAWEDAAYRIDLDVLAGRPPGLLHGAHPAPNPYPPEHVSQSADPGSWAPTVVPCGQWCPED